MKKITLLFVLLAFQLNVAQNITFADPVLKSNLMGSDINSDGEISVTEALNVHYLNFDGYNVTNLSGLEYFDNATQVEINQFSCIMDLSPLTGMASLNTLRLYFNSFISQSVFQFPALPLVNSIYIQNANVATVDFTALSNCENIEIANLSQLQTNTININNLTQLKLLDISGTSITQLNIQSNTNLETIRIRECATLSNLDVTNLTHLKDLNIHDNPLISVLDLSNKPELVSVFTYNMNNLNQINLTGSTAVKTIYLFNCAVGQLNTSGLTQLEHLTVYNSVGSNTLTSLNLTNNTALNYINIRSGGLTQIDLSAQTQLKQLYITQTPLTNLNLSNNTQLEKVYLSIIPLTQIDLNALQTLKELSLYFIPLTSINLNSLTNLEKLSCSNNQIPSINLANNTNLIELKLEQNPISTLDLSALTHLEVLWLSTLPISTLNTNTNLMLRDIFISSCNNIDSLDFSNYNTINQSFAIGLNLESMVNLHYLFLKNGVNDGYSFYLNSLPNIEYICIDESDITSLMSLNASFINPSVVVNSYCSFNPGGNYNTITGNIQYDFNANGCDTNDIDASLLGVKMNNGTSDSYAYSNFSGNYTFFVDNGNFVLTPQFTNTYFSVSPPSVTVPFATANSSSQTVNFCVSPNGVHPDLEVIISPIQSARPGFDASYLLTYKNKGNQVQSGSVQFTFDDSVMDYLGASITPTTVGTGALSWNFSNLNPFDHESIIISFNINSPQETPAVNIDDVLNYTAQITPVAGDETTADNSFLYNETVTGSYDPNDKMCLEGSTVSTTKIGDYLHYQIRFQNTGNAPAENVVIKDIIDTTKFDIATLQLINTSHDSSSRIVNGNQVEFIFPNIMLPGEQVDEPGSHGYVLFKIKTKTNLTNGSTVNNTASIYFDYNYPIITNTAQTTFTNLGVEEMALEGVTIYPNPVQNTLQVKAKQLIESVQILDHQGRVLEVQIQNEMATQLNFEKYPKGIYFVKVRTSSGTAVHKIVKD